MTPLNAVQYRQLVYRLCCMPPGRMRDRLARIIVDCLVEFYSATELPIPPGLATCSSRLSLRSAERMPDPAPSASPSAAWAIGGIEPSRTIHTPPWAAAIRKLAAPPAGGNADEWAALRDLAHRIEVGWVFVRPILVTAQHAGEEASADPVFQFAVETAELYRELARTVSEWIAAPGPAKAHETDSMVCEVDRLAAHIAVLDLASRGSPRGDVLAADLQHLAREVPAWCAAIKAVVATLGALWDIGDDEAAAAP